MVCDWHVRCWCTLVEYIPNNKMEWSRGETGGPEPPPPGKLQVAIDFLRNTGADPFRVGSPYDPLWDIRWWLEKNNFVRTPFPSHSRQKIPDPPMNMDRDVVWLRFEVFASTLQNKTWEHVFYNAIDVIIIQSYNIFMIKLVAEFPLREFKENIFAFINH